MLRSKVFIALLVIALPLAMAAQSPDEKAEAILKKAVEKLGGERYRQVKSIYGRGLFTAIREGQAGIPSSFVDVIVFGNEFKERTDFKQGGIKTTQTNIGNKGWIYDGAAQAIKDQSQEETDNFLQGLQTSLDHLLRGLWRGNAEVSYVGKRAASLGRRNEVIKLAYKNGFEIEFEFSAADGLPVKSLFKKKNAENEEVREEDRYAQFVEISGVLAPFIIDRYRNGELISRINYDSLEFNKMIPDSIFAKPANIKEAKKDLKF